MTKSYRLALVVLPKEEEEEEEEEDEEETFGARLRRYASKALNMDCVGPPTLGIASSAAVSDSISARAAGFSKSTAEDGDDDDDDAGAPDHRKSPRSTPWCSNNVSCVSMKSVRYESSGNTNDVLSPVFMCVQ